MNWYRLARQCTALRKHVLRVDMHVHCGEETDFRNENDLDATVKSVLTSAIIKGLDVVGIIGHTGPDIGHRATKIIKDSQIDLYAIPGQEYNCVDKWHIIVYNLPQALQPGLTLEQVTVQAHKQNGFVMVIQVTKRQAQHLNNMIEEKSPNAPNAIEVYNAVTGGYQDLHISNEYPKFMSSASKTAHEMEEINVFTFMGRKDLEALGLLPTDTGVEYTPQYLQRKDQLQQGANPDDVAEGLTDKAEVQPEVNPTDYR